MVTARTARTTLAFGFASLWLAACASTPESASLRGASGSAYAVDAQYVEAINRVSRETGVTVVRINPPRPGDRKD